MWITWIATTYSVQPVTYSCPEFGLPVSVVSLGAVAWILWRAWFRRGMGIGEAVGALISWLVVVTLASWLFWVVVNVFDSCEARWLEPEPSGQSESVWPGGI